MSHRRGGDRSVDDDMENQTLLKSSSSSLPFPSYSDFKVNLEHDKSITRFQVRPPTFTYRQRVGKMYALSRRTVFGPCWMMTLVTASLVIIIPFSLLHAMKHEIRGETIFLTSCWVGITLIMLFLTACTNPGIYPIVREIPEHSNQRWAYCKETDSYRPPGVIYDRECGVLIADVDHFCPWVGTTIAKANLCRFFCFVGLLLLTVCWITYVAMADAGLLSEREKYHHH